MPKKQDPEEYEENTINEDDDDNEEISETEIIEDDNLSDADNDNISIHTDEFVVNTDITEYLTGNKRISRPILTDYEAVRIIGERTKQLLMGAKPLIKVSKKIDYEALAIEEFKNNQTPYKIIRPLPNGKLEIWNLDELSKDYLKIF